MAEGELMAGDCVEPRFRASSSLMARVLERDTPDDELLGLINRYLKAGVRIEGRTVASTEGVPHQQ